VYAGNVKTHLYRIWFFLLCKRGSKKRSNKKQYGGKENIFFHVGFLGYPATYIAAGWAEK
jgi:hypothetical protein